MGQRTATVRCLAAAAIAFVCGCSVNSGDAPLNEQAITVVAERVRLVGNSQRLRYSGTIEEFKTISAAFPVPGTVKEVLVREGQAVNQGQLLARLDDTTFENAYQIAEASYNRATDAVQRLRPMFQAGTLPDIDMVEAETGLTVARAEMDEASKNLEDCELRATEHGMIGKRSINVGSGVAPGVAAMTIVQTGQVYAVVSVHENEINALQRGMPAEVSVPALGHREWSGTVDEIGVVASLLSHTYKVKVIVANHDRTLRPGMISNVLIQKQSGDTAVGVPVEAVMVDERGDTFVYTVDPSHNVAVKTPVLRGDYLLEGIEITEGLKAGDLVVTAGQHRLYSQAPVSAIVEDRPETGVRQ